jgi:hypothetical protein
MLREALQRMGAGSDRLEVGAARAGAATGGVGREGWRGAAAEVARWAAHPWGAAAYNKWRGVFEGEVRGRRGRDWLPVGRSIHLHGV